MRTLLRNAYIWFCVVVNNCIIKNCMHTLHLLNRRYETSNIVNTDVNTKITIVTNCTLQNTFSEHNFDEFLLVYFLKALIENIRIFTC